MSSDIRIPERYDLLGLTREDLIHYFKLIGEKPFRAKQFLKWAYQFRLRDFEPMTDMPIPLRAKLAERAKIGRLKITEAVKSDDGATKLALALEDGRMVEAVHIPAGNRDTACISSQVGCAYKCRFCATGEIGFIRNLNSGEIVGQLLALEEHLGVSMTNIVFMGMGEPLNNLEQVMRVLELFADDCAFGLGHRRVTISTVGIPKKIKELKKSGLKPKLAVSLNAPNDDLRKILMPRAAKIATIVEILEAASRYAIDTGRWFTVEYVLIRDVNDSISHADILAQIIHDMPCKVNLIPYNPYSGGKYMPPTPEAVTKFQGYLM
ncbi:MAG: 23S rRNA (adenine(2503)-C(2))-methyltransferase RlmN, partial [bacterium]